ncbi:MAG: hypothetical protein WC379_15095 [Methanoregula sp.]|jgi:hypothetical protein
MEFFLADDILQGEEVPFYLLWDGKNPKETILEISGFDSITEFHNVAEFTNEDNKYTIKKLHVDGYLGGLISTKITENPVVVGKLQIQFIPETGDAINFEESRNLYTTSVKMVDTPKTIHLTTDSLKEKFSLQLKGKTTIFFEVEESEGNECKIDLPPDLKELREKVRADVSKGFKELEIRFPQHRETLELMLELDNSMQSFETLPEENLNQIEKSFEDREFAENVLMIIFTTATKHLESRKSLINSLQEYFESYSSKKAYFINPLLQVYVNKCESCKFAIRIRAFDLKKGECGKPIEVKTILKSDIDYQSPVKDLFAIERKNDD